MEIQTVIVESPWVLKTAYIKTVPEELIETFKSPALRSCKPYKALFQPALQGSFPRALEGPEEPLGAVQREN